MYSKFRGYHDTCLPLKRSVTGRQTHLCSCSLSNVNDLSDSCDPTYVNMRMLRSLGNVRTNNKLNDQNLTCISTKSFIASNQIYDSTILYIIYLIFGRCLIICT